MQKNNKIFAVILSGCGVFDGSEIHEAVLTLLAISNAGCTYQAFAPNVDQHDVINHLTKTAMPEKRNVLVESARIVRGNILPLTNFDADKYDALILPGGFGAAKNLSGYAINSSNYNINPDVKNAVLKMVEANKPIGALCIAPVILAKLIKNAIVTVGSDVDSIKSIEKLGATHIVTGQTQITVDVKNKLVTSPCYMLGASITQIAQSAQNVVNQILKLIG